MLLLLGQAASAHRLISSARSDGHAAAVAYNHRMPVYEFQCTACGERFEILCGLAERDSKAVCPSCGGRDVGQVLVGGFRVGISRTRLNPGHFERRKGKAPEYKPPPDG
jgi:putative FmdB family regulatory protein